jgi:hypothetical protein
VGSIKARSPATEIDARRWAIDIAILGELGRFFAGKLRAAVWYELYMTTRDPAAIHRAIDAYRGARQAWVEGLTPAKVYADDLTFGPEQRLRGHWGDRLAAIDADLHDMQERSASADPAAVEGPEIKRLLDAAADPAAHVAVMHVPPATFRPGEPVELAIQLRGSRFSQVDVRYRAMQQALPMSARTLDRTEGGFIGSIPAEEIDGAFPLSYAFVVHDGGGHAWRYPGIGVDLASQPYFVVRRAFP